MAVGKPPTPPGGRVQYSPLERLRSALAKVDLQMIEIRDILETLEAIDDD
jgi:hypothetical protein